MLDALIEENYESSEMEDERVEAIMIAPRHEEEEDTAENDPEDSRVVANDTCIKTAADQKQKSDRTRRKAERTLMHAWKAWRQPRLAPDAENDQEEEGTAGDDGTGSTNDKINDIGTPAKEGAPTDDVNIELKIPAN